MGAADFKFRDAAAKEEGVSQFIPYQSHVTKNVIKLDGGDYVVAFRMQGAAHESADAQDINMWHAQLNNFLRNLASPNVAVWTHVVRREYNEYPGGQFAPGFAADFNTKYAEAHHGQRGLINELYVSLIYRPQPVKALKLFDLFSRPSRDQLAEQQAEELEAVQGLIDTTIAALDRYEPEMLGLYEHRGQLFSELAEFLGLLINGEWHRQPVSRGLVRDSLATSRPIFGKGGLLALKGPTRTQFGAMLTLQEYPTPTCPGLLNELLSMPFEFILSQSFTFLSKPVALGRMKRQHDRMVNAGDVAVSQVEAIAAAMDGLASGQFVMGTHSLSLLVLAADQKSLNEHVGDAGSVFADAGAKWAREDVGIAGAFWAQLPGNFSYRIRMGDITSFNFAGFSSFHNFPIGHIRHNQWGDAVTVLRSTAGSPYYFNWHRGEAGSEAKRSARLDPNHKDLANTIIIGMSGSGKTVLQTFLLAQSMKFNNPDQKGGDRLTGVFFDKDLGASVAVRALGGRYYALKNGQPSGFNPFKLPYSPGTVSFIESLIHRLVRDEARPLSPADKRDIAAAIQGVFEAPESARRLGAVMQFLPMGDPNGIHSRLQRWAGPNAPLGWLFDNEADTLDVDNTPVLGFDVTEFLENDETREPTIMYLFHRVEKLLDGRRVPIFFDEFGQLSKDEAFRELVENKLVTIRKQNGFVIMGTQMPEQVLRLPIAPAIIQQTATMIFLPNPKASREEYVDGMRLTEREYEIIKSFGEKSRMFLVKQGHNSVVCRMNLRGFDDELAVLSGNTRTAALVERLVTEYSSDPAVWLPEFHRVRKGGQ